MREPCMPGRCILLNEACGEQSLKNSEQAGHMKMCINNMHISYKIYLKRKTVAKESSYGSFAILF